LEPRPGGQFTPTTLNQMPERPASRDREVGSDTNNITRDLAQHMVCTTKAPIRLPRNREYNRVPKKDGKQGIIKRGQVKQIKVR